MDRLALSKDAHAAPGAGPSGRLPLAVPTRFKITSELSNSTASGCTGWGWGARRWDRAPLALCPRGRAQAAGDPATQAAAPPHGPRGLTLQSRGFDRGRKETGVARALSPWATAEGHGTKDGPLLKAGEGRSRTLEEAHGVGKAPGTDQGTLASVDGAFRAGAGGGPRGRGGGRG